MGNKEVFAARLKEARMQTGKTQKEFADIVESTAATISAYENATKNPSLEIVINIAQKCNISIDWLCGLSEQKELKPEIKNFKDFALRLLELLEVDTCYSLYIDEVKMGKAHMPALVLPDNSEFRNFIETYKELCKLLNNNQIREYVLNTWLNGALEDLKEVPITIDFSDKEMLKIIDTLYESPDEPPVE